MPKQKTHSGAKKRFKVTGTGKIKVMGTKMRHNLEKKSSKKRRELSRDVVLFKQDEKVAKKLLNI
jgi:large subunit ribosomal protein L35